MRNDESYPNMCLFPLNKQYSPRYCWKCGRKQYFLGIFQIFKLRIYLTFWLVQGLWSCWFGVYTTR